MLATTKTDKQVRKNGYMETNWILKPMKKTKTDQPQECARKCTKETTQQKTVRHDKTLQVWKGARKICDRCTKTIIADTCMEGWYAQPRRYGSIWAAMDIVDELDLTHKCAERYYRCISGYRMEIWIRIKKTRSKQGTRKMPARTQSDGIKGRRAKDTT